MNFINIDDAYINIDVAYINIDDAYINIVDVYKIAGLQIEMISHKTNSVGFNKKHDSCKPHSVSFNKQNKSIKTRTESPTPNTAGYTPKAQNGKNIRLKHSRHQCKHQTRRPSRPKDLPHTLPTADKAA